MVEREERGKKEADLRLTAPEDDGSEMQLRSYSGLSLSQNNTITRNHSLNCFLQIERGLDGRLSGKIRIKDWAEQSRMGC